MTVDAPWNPSEVNISMTLSMQPVSTLESLEYRRVCAVEGIVTRTNDTGEESDLSTYDEAALIRRMVGAVNIATSYREPAI